jgi:hypothetical protein
MEVQTMDYIKEIEALTELIDALDPEHGVTIVSIPDIVQVKYDFDTHTSYVLYNGDKYDSFEDCMEKNDYVAEHYYCHLAYHLEQLQSLTDNN